MLKITDDNSTVVICEGSDLQTINKVPLDLKVADAILDYDPLVTPAAIENQMKDIISASATMPVGKSYNYQNYSITVTQKDATDGEYDKDYTILVTTELGLRLFSSLIKTKIAGTSTTLGGRIYDAFSDAVINGIVDQVKIGLIAQEYEKKYGTIYTSASGKTLVINSVASPSTDDIKKYLNYSTCLEHGINSIYVQNSGITYGVVQGKELTDLVEELNKRGFGRDDNFTRIEDKYKDLYELVVANPGLGSCLGDGNIGALDFNLNKRYILLDSERTLLFPYEGNNNSNLIYVPKELPIQVPIFGLDGNDTIIGSSLNDTIYGNDGPNSKSYTEIHTEYGNNRLVMPNEYTKDLDDDILVGNGGSDEIHGGKGNDTIFGDYFDAKNLYPINIMQNPDNTFTDSALMALENGFNNGADKLYGDEGNDFIVGGGGNEVIDGGKDKDTIYGGTGDDILKGGSGDDKLYGDFEILISGNDGKDSISGGEGCDTIIGGAGNDTIYGDTKDQISFFDGSDSIVGGQGEDKIYGGRGSDTIYGGSENDILDGGLGSDEIYGGDGQDYLYGQGNNDTLDGGGNNDIMIGGVGYDTYFVDNTGDIVTENANEGTDDVFSSVSYSLGNNVENIELTGIENVNATGNTLANIIKGNSGNNILTGGGGDDTIYGGGGNDVLNGGEGTDSYYIKEGSSITTINDSDGKGSISYGNSGLSLFNTYKNSFTNGVCIDSNGNQYSWSGVDGTKLTINVRGNIINVENFSDGDLGIRFYENTYQDNSITVAYHNQVVQGTAGNDHILINSHYYDTITDPHTYKPCINNTIYAGDGNDVIAVTLTNEYAGETIYGGNGHDEITLDHSSNNTVYGGEGNDNINASGNSNYVDAGDGNDTIKMFSYTQKGGSTVHAGSGDDKVYLDVNDTIYGGTGDDLYVQLSYHNRNGSSNTIVENANEGIDTVQTDVSFVLSSNIENIELTASEYSVIGRVVEGNGLNNLITEWKARSYSIDSVADTLMGGAGNDTYVIFNDASTVIIDSEGIDTVEINGNARHLSDSYTLGNNLENLILRNSCFDTIVGNELGNVLTTINSNVTVIGGAGNDTLISESGCNTYVFNSGDGQDIIIDNGGGNDKIRFGAGITAKNLIFTNTGSGLVIGYDGGTITLANQSDYSFEFADGKTFSINALMFGSAENDHLEGSSSNDNIYGNGGNDRIDGGDGDDDIYGGAGEDTLIGGNGNDGLYNSEGAKTMIGGAGNDTYHIEYDYQTLIEKANEGIDTVMSSVSHTLETNIENLTFIETADVNGTGNELNNVITGNTGNNVINGGAGSDTLSGGGGLDTLIGGLGNDIYFVNNSSDVVIENENEGMDQVSSTISYELGDNFENLILSGTNSVNATGNSLNNSIEGNSGNNVITGGLGNDNLNDTAGGNDTYIFNIGDGQDKILDSSGLDTIKFGEGITQGKLIFNRWGNDLGIQFEGSQDQISIQDWYLNQNNQIEKLEFSDSSFLTDINNYVKMFNGSDGNDQITGNSLDNQFNGGLGADTMSGGLGNDQYIIDNIGDVVLENQNEGKDQIVSSVDYALGANVEELMLWGNDAINATGNSLDNSIGGSSANNVITGGLGNDYIFDNFGGNDTYVFNKGDGQDTISDTSGNDTIRFGEGITLDNLVINKSGNDLSIQLKDSQDQIIVKDWGINSNNQIEKIEFNNGASIVNLSDYIRNLYGTEQNDYISGNLSNNIVAGGLCNDYIVDTAGGNDTYIFNIGDGQDKILDSSGLDTIKFGEGITQGKLIFNRWGNDLGIQFEGSQDQISIQDWYLNQNNQIEKLEFSDSSFLTDINNYVKMFNGSDGNDQITGNSLDNQFNGGLGADTMSGGLGNDQYIIDNIGDVVLENQNEGKDQIVSSVDYALGANVEELMLWGNDAINATGNSLDNSIGGSSANNVITGGLGNDYIFDNFGGNDTYVFNKGDGQDTISDTSGNDTIRFGEGITLDNLVINKSGNDLSIQIKDSQDQIIVRDWVINSNNQIEKIEFNNGASIVNLSDYIRNLYGTEQNDYITGNLSDNIVAGGLGNDLIIDTVGGNDSYVFNKGDGQDTISDTSGNDTIRFGEGITLDNLVINKSGNDLSIQLKDSQDQIIVQNWNMSLENQIEKIEFADGTFISNINLYTNNFYGSDQEDFISGNSKNNSITGGQGNDYLTDTAGGDDTYIYNLGDGQDYLVDVNGSDTIKFGEGISLANVRFNRESNNLLVWFEGSEENINIENYFANENNNKIEKFEFADGSFINDISDLLVQFHGSEQDNEIYGNVKDNFIDGHLGSDTIIGGQGNDYITDTEGGNETYVYNLGDGNDYVVDTAGIDTIKFGAGITLDNIRFGKEPNNLNIWFDGVENSGIAIENHFSNENNKIENFEFADGTSIHDLNELITNFNGSNQDDTIIGNTQNNYIDGREGADTMNGGVGDDCYMVDNNGDVTIENENEGSDRVESNVTYQIGANIEQLVLNGNESINGTGNSLDNYIQGNSGNNVITGGLGNDNINDFNGGDDIYVFNQGDGQDTIVDINGYDTIKFGQGITQDNLILSRWGNDLGIEFQGSEDKIVIPNWNFGPDNQIEKIEFADGSSITNINDMVTNFIGTDQNDTNVGNNQDNWIDGLSGSDTMIGGLGDDAYVVDDVADVVVENANEGSSDGVFSHISYELGANVECLILEGTEATNATGNALDNQIRGNSANNILSGKGGNDIYRFRENWGQDTIIDSEGTNTIELKANLASTDLGFSLNGNNLEISQLNSDNKITVTDWNVSDSYKMSSVTLLDGTVISKTDIDSMIAAQTANALAPVNSQSAPESYISDSDINNLIHQINSYAAESGMMSSTVDESANNQDLLNLVATY